MAALYVMPSAVLFMLSVALAIGVTCAGQTFVHRRFKSSEFVSHNEVAGFIIAVVGSLYAVVLGFVTVVVWQQYGGTQDRLALESAAVGDAWHLSVGLPRGVRNRVRSDMVSYAHEMIDREWPLMHRGSFSRRGDVIIMDATSVVGGFLPTDLRASNAQAATLQQLATLHDARQRRLESNQSGISWFQWAVLWVGAIVVIGFCYIFGLPNARTHLVMTSAVAVIVASMFVLIFELERPFRGDLGIASTPWVGFLTHVRMMDMSGPTDMRM